MCTVRMDRPQLSIFAWKSALEPVPGQANMQNRLAMMCCHRRSGVRVEGYGEPSTPGAAAPQSQPSLGCCPCVCTRAQSERRPTTVPPTSLRSRCPKLRHASCVFGKRAPLGPSVDLHWSPVVYGLAWSICLSRFARGRVPPCVRPSVDVSFFLVRSDKNAGEDVQSMGENNSWQSVTGPLVFVASMS